MVVLKKRFVVHLKLKLDWASVFNLATTPLEPFCPSPALLHLTGPISQLPALLSLRRLGGRRTKRTRRQVPCLLLAEFLVTAELSHRPISGQKCQKCHGSRKKPGPGCRESFPPCDLLASGEAAAALCCKSPHCPPSLPKSAASPATAQQFPVPYFLCLKDLQCFPFS